MKLRNDHIYKFQCSRINIYTYHTESSKAIMSRLSFLLKVSSRCFELFLFYVIIFIFNFYLFIYYFFRCFLE